MKILLHMCCSNCSLYPVKLLRAEKQDITGFWFNPNIHPREEYEARLDSLKRLSGEWRLDVIYTEDFTPQDYFALFNLSVRDVSDANRSGDAARPPFPERCISCYRLRLEHTARNAREQGYDAFSTTLLISPYQDFERIVAAGKEMSDKYRVLFHVKDYRPHFRDAMALSKELGLYRQKYCGCIFSREERCKKGTEAQRHKGTT